MSFKNKKDHFTYCWQLWAVSSGGVTTVGGATGWFSNYSFLSLDVGKAVAQGCLLLVDPSVCFSIHLCIPFLRMWKRGNSSELPQTLRLRDELFKFCFLMSKVRAAVTTLWMSIPFLWTRYLRNALKEPLWSQLDSRINWLDFSGQRLKSRVIIMTNDSWLFAELLSAAELTVFFFCNIHLKLV